MAVFSYISFSYKMSSKNIRSRLTIFAGKGGVGKTTCAATTALHHASRGESTLVISTDATPSLLHIFESQAKEKPVKVRENLSASELGAAEVREMWDRKFGREVYEVFSSFVDVGYPEFVEFMTSLLPGLSDEFMVDYIRELSSDGRYSNIVWDTAPLGQTLTLLQTPALLAEHLRLAPRIYSRLKLGTSSREPLIDIIKRWEKLSGENMDFLRNDVRFNLVTIPEALAVQQLDGVLAEMRQYGLKVSGLIVNNVIRADGSEFLNTRALEQQRYLEFIRERYADLAIAELPMFPYEIRGLERIEQMEKVLFGAV
jgi:arsenite-transporting ATPase